MDIKQHLDAGHASLRDGDPEAAVTSYKNALALDPRHLGALGGLAAALNQLGRSEQAVSVLNMALGIAPGNAAFHVQLGNLHRKRRRTAQAMAAFQAALALNPRLPGAHAGMASILNAQGKPEEAVAALHTAIEIAPNSAGLHVRLGQVLEERHELAEAAAAFRAALEVDPANALAQAGLRRVRDPNGIFECFQVLLQNPDDAATLGRLAAQLGSAPAALAQLIGFGREPREAGIAAIAKTPLDEEIFRSIVRTARGQEFQNVQEAPPAADALAEQASHEDWTEAQWLNAFLLRQIRPSHQLAAVVTMRDEGLYILEWIAHYRVLGVETIFVYSNGNQDGSEALLRDLAALGIITYIENRMGDDQRHDPQKKAFAHALHLLPALWAHEWVLFADADEFLLPAASYGTIGALIDDAVSRYPARAPSVICFNWRWYVSGQTYAYEPKPLLRRFQHAVDRRGMKSLVRLRDIFSMHRIHFPELAPGGFMLRSDFSVMEKSLRWTKPEPVFGSAQLNHYWSKSFEEFSIKRLRGNATNLPIWQREFSQFFSNNAAETQADFVPPPETHVLRVEAEMAQLQALPGIAARMADIRAGLPKLLKRFDAEGGLRAIFARMRGPIPTTDAVSANLALGRPALLSSTAATAANEDDLAREAARANNGAYAKSQTFMTKHERNPWWQVDLGSSFLIEQVVIHNRDKLKERLARFTLLRSNDGIEWFPFYRKSDFQTFDTHVARPDANCLARFVRVRLDGLDILHFRECEVYGTPPDDDLRQRLLDEDFLRRNEQRALPAGRTGHVSLIEDCFVFVDGQYGPNLRTVIDNGNYEGRERKLVKDFLRPGDRVLELGTAIGVLTMTAAALVGAENVTTFDANPEIVADAQANFRRNNLPAIVSRWGLLKNRACFKPGETADFHIHEVFVASRLNVPGKAPGFVKTVQAPVFCLEEEIASANANVLLCDIEGAEVELFGQADLSGIRLIVMETHYPVAGEVRTDAMIRKLTVDGFSIHLEASGGGVVLLRRPI